MATVGEDPIHAREVQRLLTLIARGQAIHPAARPLLQAQLLEELVQRRLVLAYARRLNEAPTAKEMDASRAALVAKLGTQRKSVDDFLKDQSITEADLERQLAWNLVWEKYLARYATDDRLESYFRVHQRELDGSQVVVSQILLRPKAGEGPQAMDELVGRAEALRQEIASGKVSFAQAAQRSSAGATAANGGQLGPITRHGAMDEAFSRAAFVLEVGQISPPVRTRFGVHLIQCNEIRPGTKKWSDVRGELEDALARELLGKLAEIQRRYTPVRYAMVLPHFKPGTRELVVPETLVDPVQRPLVRPKVK